MNNSFGINRISKDEIIIFNSTSDKSSRKNGGGNPIIKKRKTVQIVGENGAEVNLEMLDLVYMDMHNGHKFITGKVHEKRTVRIQYDASEDSQ